MCDWLGDRSSGPAGLWDSGQVPSLTLPHFLYVREGVGSDHLENFLQIWIPLNIRNTTCLPTV